MVCRFVTLGFALFHLSCSQEPPVSSPSSAFAEESGPWQTVSINGATYRRVAAAAKPTETSQADLLITIPISYTVEGGAVRFSDTVQIAGRTYTADCSSTPETGGDLPIGGGQDTNDDVGDTRDSATTISVNHPPTGSTGLQPTVSDEFYLTEDDVDYFRLRIFKTVGLGVTTLSNIDTQGVLYDSSGTIIAMNDNDDDFLEADPSDFNFFLAALAEPGTYYVKVTEGNRSNSQGPYNLVILTLNPDAAGKVVAQSIKQQMKQALR